MLHVHVCSERDMSLLPQSRFTARIDIFSGPCEEAMAERDLETWNRSRYIHIGMISVGSMLVMATCMCSCTYVVF